MKLSVLAWGSELTLISKAVAGLESETEPKPETELKIELSAWSVYELKEDRQKLAECIRSFENADIILIHPSGESYRDEIIEAFPEKTPVVSFGYSDTFLSAGLMQGMKNLMQEKKRNGDLIPMMVLITDGRANSAGKKTKDEIIAIAEEIRLRNIHTVVIDTEAQENSFINMQLGYCRDIAEHSGGRYYSMEELSAEGIGSVAALERDNFLGTVR